MSACPPLKKYPAVLPVPLVPAVDIPACDEVGAPAVVGDVLVGAVGGVVVDGVVVLGGIADPGVELDGGIEPDGGIGAVGVGDVVVGDAVVGAVADGLPIEPLLLDGVDDDPVAPVPAAAPVMPGAPGDPALPIVGFERTKDGIAVAAPAELVGDVTHPVTVTICAPLAPLVAAPGVVWVCAAAPATTDAASAVANAICLFMIVLS